MIGGLKQESHLSELVKVSISYVKELKKSLVSNTGSPPTISNSHILNTASVSGKPPMQRSLTINQWASKQSPPQITDRRPPFGTSFSIEAPGSSPNSAFSSRMRSITLTSCDKSDLEPLPVTAKRPSLSSSIWFNSLKLKDLSDSLVDLDNQSRKEEVVQQQQAAAEVPTEPVTNTKSAVAAVVSSDNNTADNFLIKTQLHFNSLKNLPHLIKQDSFKFLRLTLSTVILVFSLLFFLLTFLQDKDFYEN